MNSITSYKTPQDYLDDTEQFLLQKELENNLILGLCYGFPDRTKEYENTVFINSIEQGVVQATSIKTWVKAIVSGKTKDKEQIKPLAEYYLNKGIQLAGVVGETFYAEQFAEYYTNQITQKKAVLVHKLTLVNRLPLASGNLIVATDDDLELVTQWTMNFEEDAQTFPKKTREEVIQSTKSRLAQGDIFKWMDKGEPVSISAIVRRTKNIGIVGLVYTPDIHRGKGYATSCVQKLSEHILQSGYRHCGLFTDKENPTSNGIYRKIGYIPLTEFSDIEFGG